MNTARKLILIAASIPFFAAPAVSSADEAGAMDACINAFVSANQLEDRKLRVKPLRSDGNRFAVHTPALKITLWARGVESGKLLAHGTCLVDRRGAVIAMNGQPLATLADAKLSSR